MLAFCEGAKSCAWLRSRRVKNAALLTDDQPRPLAEMQAGAKEQAF